MIPKLRGLTLFDRDCIMCINVQEVRTWYNVFTVSSIVSNAASTACLNFEPIELSAVEKLGSAGKSW